MIWVAWRQQRAQLLISTAVVAAVAAAVLLVRFDAVGYLREHGIEGCLVSDDGRCSSAAMNAFNLRYRPYAESLVLVLLGLPVVLGVFTGAPLFAREFEQGTHIFAQSQSVGRNRWWATKLLISGLPVIAAMAVLSLVTAWGLRPLSFLTRGRMMTPGFETQGLVVAAYTVLAFAIGAAAGLVARNTVVAMALTIVVYLGLLVLVAQGVRDRYLDPLEQRGLVAQGAAMPGGRGQLLIPDDAWRVGSGFFNDAGTEVAFDGSSCRNEETFEDCVRREGIASISAQYHPDDRFWRFQLIESGIFLAISVGLLGFGLWALRRRPL